MKKFIALALTALMLLTLAAGCGKTSESTAIYVVSREEGSGTRGAFIELFGIEQKNEAGEKIDHTVETAEVTDSTSVMMQTIAGNKAAIGYISLGSLNDTVKALQIDGVDATAENVKNGTYKIARPFNVATLANVSPEAQDFLNFILSAEGQAVVEKANCISEGNTGAFTGGSVSGKIVVAGSSSVTPVMEKLKEAYNAINPNLTIDIQQSDSSNGMKSAIEGLCDIGMASRDLKDSELEAGLTPTAIALDGIAVIVNTESERSGLTSDQVRAIFMGELTDWSEVK
ncbi:MAG: substrate-binding domain-containing protein [Christensenellales bacterium]